jgi:RNA polymerase sigma-70 factor (ECF subfamily)
MKYYPQILSLILLKINNIEDARDLCQEIFIIFYEKCDTIDNIRPWLYGTMKNVLYRYYAAKKQSVDIDQLFNSQALSFANGFRDTRIIINEAIDHTGCNDEGRIIFDLIARHNFSYNHVARILGYTRRQIEYRYTQLVKSVLAYLKDKGITDIKELL